MNRSACTFQAGGQYTCTAQERFEDTAKADPNPCVMTAKLSSRGKPVASVSLQPSYTRSKFNKVFDDKAWGTVKFTAACPVPNPNSSNKDPSDSVSPLFTSNTSQDVLNSRIEIQEMYPLSKIECSAPNAQYARTAPGTNVVIEPPAGGWSKVSISGKFKVKGVKIEVDNLVYQAANS